jgi:hypothetical protein
MQRLRSRQIAAMLGINLACDKQENAGTGEGVFAVCNDRIKVKIHTKQQLNMIRIVLYTFTAIWI